MNKSVWKIKGFLPYVIVVFLNAFTDLGHKIIIQNTIFKIYDGEIRIILTAIVNALILLPFILLFSPSGFLSDRYAKSTLLRLLAGGVHLKSNLKLLHKNRSILLSIIGLSLFWGTSQVILSSFPEYAKDTLSITNTVLVQGMMAIVGIGIVRCLHYS